MKKFIHVSEHPVLITSDSNAKSGKVGPMTIIRTTPEMVRLYRWLFDGGRGEPPTK